MPDLFGREGFERRSAEPRQLANDAATSTASQSGKLRGVRSAQGPYREHQDTIRRAKPEEAQLLTELCMRSKAYWGYDAAFLEGFRRERNSLGFARWCSKVTRMLSRSTVQWGQNV